MFNRKRIIKALNQLNAVRDEHKEWLATRKKIGANLDPDNVDVLCDYAQVLDPYGICSSFPTELSQIGREYFARETNGDIWVSFDDLPKETVSKLWPRMQAGDFDREWDGSADGELAKQLDDGGISPYKMFWQPRASALARVPLAGRVAARTTDQAHVPLIVKDADRGSFVLIIKLSHRTFYMAGWIEVGAAKKFPSLTALGSAVHFIEQSQLERMDDLKKYVETGLGKWVDSIH